MKRRRTYLERMREETNEQEAIVVAVAITDNLEKEGEGKKTTTTTTRRGKRALTGERRGCIGLGGKRKAEALEARKNRT